MSMVHGLWSMVYCQPYSVLRFFTGFAFAALTAWKLIVTKAISSAIIAAITNIHQPILILYVKSSSHLRIAYQARGVATAMAIVTRIMKSLDNNPTISGMLAPSTFLIPISLVLC